MNRSLIHHHRQCADCAAQNRKLPVIRIEKGAFALLVHSLRTFHRAYCPEISINLQQNELITTITPRRSINRSARTNCALVNPSRMQISIQSTCGQQTTKSSTAKDHDLMFGVFCGLVLRLLDYEQLLTVIVYCLDVSANMQICPLHKLSTYCGRMKRTRIVP